MAREKLPVSFETKKGRSTACLCSACHDTGTVTVVILPDTHFENRELRTWYHEYWLCDDCKAKLLEALKGGAGSG